MSNLITSLQTRFQGLRSLLKMTESKNSGQAHFVHIIYAMAAVLDPNYGFVWLDADHPGDDSVKKTVRDTITNVIIFEAEQCCSTAELETASQSEPCQPCTSEASTANPPPLKRCRSSLFASYERHSAKVSAVASQQQMNLWSVVMEYLEYVTTPRTPNSDPWVEVARSDTYKVLHPLLEKVFCPPATSAPVERIFSHSGLLMRANRARMGDNMLSPVSYTHLTLPTIYSV